MWFWSMHTKPVYADDQLYGALDAVVPSVAPAVLSSSADILLTQPTGPPPDAWPLPCSQAAARVRHWAWARLRGTARSCWQRILHRCHQAAWQVGRVCKVLQKRRERRICTGRQPLFLAAYLALLPPGSLAGRQGVKTVVGMAQERVQSRTSQCAVAADEVCCQHQ